MIRNYEINNNLGYDFNCVDHLDVVYKTFSLLSKETIVIGLK